MEYCENPVVEGGFDRKLTFPQIKWLSKARFEEFLSSNCQVCPCLNDEPGVEINKRIYVGKLVPKRPPDFTDEQNSVGNLLLSNYHYLELIGNVIRKEELIDNKRVYTWVLRITYHGHAYEIDDDFLVLHIEDPNTYFWSSNMDFNHLNGELIYFPKKDLPTYAIRAAFDRIDQKYNYIGR